jgi:hypothetical protein
MRATARRGAGWISPIGATAGLAPGFRLSKISAPSSSVPERIIFLSRE